MNDAAKTIAAVAGSAFVADAVARDDEDRQSPGVKRADYWLAYRAIRQSLEQLRGTYSVAVPRAGRRQLDPLATAADLDAVLSEVLRWESQVIGRLADMDDGDVLDRSLVSGTAYRAAMKLVKLQLCGNAETDASFADCAALGGVDRVPLSAAMTFWSATREYVLQLNSTTTVEDVSLGDEIIAQIPGVAEAVGKLSGRVASTALEAATAATAAVVRGLLVATWPIIIGGVATAYVWKEISK